MHSLTFLRPISFSSLVASLLLAACGPGGGELSGDAGAAAADAGGVASAQLVGTWAYVSGSAVVSCSDGSSGSIPADGGTKTFTPGANASRVVVVDDQNCALACVLAGDTLTCERAVCSSGNLAVTTTSDVYTIVGAELHENSNMASAAPDGTSCQMSIVDGVLRRVQ